MSDTRQEILVSLDRLRAQEDFLQVQRAEAVRRLGEISRERERLERHLDYLEKSEAADLGSAC